jgi:hypothetical protein
LNAAAVQAFRHAEAFRGAAIRKSMLRIRPDLLETCRNDMIACGEPCLEYRWLWSTSPGWKGS